MIRSAISHFYYHRCGYPLPLQRFHQHSVRATTACTFSSTSWKPPPPTQHQQPPDHNSATIIQGPSLLTSTGVHRPSPSLFHLPGLRSLPFWTAPPEVQQQKQQQEGRRTRIAYNDPIVTAAVQHVESNYASIRSEYFSAVLGQGTDIVASLFMNNINNGGSGTSTTLSSKPLEPDYDVSTRGGEHAEDALHSGTWDWHSYILNGMRNERFREKCPKTAQVVDDVRVGVIYFFFLHVSLVLVVIVSLLTLTLNIILRYACQSLIRKTCYSEHHLHFPSSPHCMEIPLSRHTRGL